MARSIKQLLNQKGWTGEEVGKALLASLAHDARHQGEPDFTPLFSQADFERMEKSLDTNEDHLHYAIYKAIYSGLVDRFNRGQGLHQQFYHGYHRTLSNLKEAMIADEYEAIKASYPLILTEAQNQEQGDEVSYQGLVDYFLSQDKEDIPPKIREALMLELTFSSEERQQVIDELLGSGGNLSQAFDHALLNRYKAIYEGDEPDKLYEAITELYPQFKGVEDYLEPRATYRELGIHKPVAILQGSSTGFTPPSLDIDTLEDIYDRQDLITALREELIKPALRYLYAYNALASLLGEVYDIEDIEALAQDLSHFERLVEAYNNLVYIFYATVHGDKGRKREIIRALFEPIDTAELKPDEAEVEAIRSELTRSGISSQTYNRLKDLGRYITRLEVMR